MAQIIITEKQLQLINNKIILEEKIALATKNWKNLSNNEKKLVISLVEINSPSNAKLLQEKWYNTVMDVLGLVDPTPIVDTVNAVSYFSQGETLFGVLTLIAAVPGYVGDAVTKPVIGALKVGNVAGKELKVALDMAKAGQTAEATAKLAGLAKDPGIIGKFLRSAKGWGPKVVDWIDKLPAGPFKGMKNTIRDYFQLLVNAGRKSTMFQKRAGVLAKNFQKGTATVKDIELLRKYLKTQRIFNPATLTKPGFFSQVFFGGIPRLFRSPESRGIKILMSKTKFWLGFLDYLGIGNFVGPEELSKQLGGDDELANKMEDYQKTPEAKDYYKEDFKDADTQTDVDTPPAPNIKNDVEASGNDPLQSFLQRLFKGTAESAAFLI
jgi:hypothetical protein